MPPTAGSGANSSLGSIVSLWIFNFNSARRARDPGKALAELLSPDPWWRDHLALTWDLRTFHGLHSIIDFLGGTLARAGCGPFNLAPDSVQTVQMGGQISFIYASFTFGTKRTMCSGGLKLLCGTDGQWRAWNIYTRIEELKGHEQNLRRLNVPPPPVENDVDAVVLGGGQAGLQVSAALKAIGMCSVVIEENARLGDQWRQHYDSLRLHLPKQHSQFLYKPFPSSMPLYPSKDDVANFLEHYSEACKLDVFCSSRIRTAVFDDGIKTWLLEIVHRGGSSSRIRAGHLVFATGILGCSPAVPDVSGKVRSIKAMLRPHGLIENWQSSYSGTILHSAQYKRGAAWKGKRAVVVGAS